MHTVALEPKTSTMTMTMTDDDVVAVIIIMIVDQILNCSAFGFFIYRNDFHGIESLWLSGRINTFSIESQQSRAPRTHSTNFHNQQEILGYCSIRGTSTNNYKAVCGLCVCGGGSIETNCVYHLNAYHQNNDQNEQSTKYTESKLPSLMIISNL